MGLVKCNLCGADDFTVVFPKGYAQAHRIVRCNRCGLMYANPQELVDCQVLATPEHPKDFDPEVAARQYFEKERAQLPDNRRALRVLNELAPQPGKLLEIGCWCGIFLDCIRASGWQTVGLEPETAAAAYARRKYSLSVVGGTLPQPRFQDGEFDAVVMLHVIEHMPDPTTDLREIRRVLKPGGVLVVETPRLDSLSFRLLGRRERSIQNCDGHIYFFGVPTLRQLLEKCGFEVARTELVGRTLTVDRLLYNVGLIARCHGFKNWMWRIAPKLGLNKLRLHVNVRDMQRVYARAR